MNCYRILDAHGVPLKSKIWIRSNHAKSAARFIRTQTGTLVEYELVEKKRTNFTMTTNRRLEWEDQKEEQNPITQDERIIFHE